MFLKIYIFHGSSISNSLPLTVKKEGKLFSRKTLFWFRRLFWHTALAMNFFFPPCHRRNFKVLSDSSLCFQEMGSCLPQTCSTITNVPPFQPQMKSNRGRDVFANSVNFQIWHFQGQIMISSIDHSHVEVFWRKSRGCFSAMWDWVTALH